MGGGAAPARACSTVHSLTFGTLFSLFLFFFLPRSSLLSSPESTFLPPVAWEVWSRSKVAVDYYYPIYGASDFEEMKGRKTDTSRILAHCQKVSPGSTQRPPRPKRILFDWQTFSRDRTKFAQILAPASHLVPPQKDNDGKCNKLFWVMLHL